jgi:hypothetical protein
VLITADAIDCSFSHIYIICIWGARRGRVLRGIFGRWSASWVIAVSLVELWSITTYRVPRGCFALIWASKASFDSKGFELQIRQTFSFYNAVSNIPRWPGEHR